MASNNIEKRLIDFRSRSYALLKMQSSLENKSIVEIIEKAIEDYVDENIKAIVNAQYGEWEERPKRSRKLKNANIEKQNNDIVEKEKKENINTYNKNESDLADFYEDI